MNDVKNERAVAGCSWKGFAKLFIFLLSLCYIDEMEVLVRVGKLMGKLLFLASVNFLDAKLGNYSLIQFCFNTFYMQSK